MGDRNEQKELKVVHFKQILLTFKILLRVPQQQR